MVDEHDLIALLQAYIDGDTLARKALVDALDEDGDPRVELIREEAIDWDALAIGQGGRSQTYGGRTRPAHASAHLRFQIDCARFGSPTLPEVTQLVREARRKLVRKLFPELPL